MNLIIRNQALSQNIPLVEYILKSIKEEKASTGVNRSIFAACPNSIAVIKAALRSAKRNDAPIKFATTLNQVDTDRGYTKMNHQEFVDTVKKFAEQINLEVPVLFAIDHGGPWLKDRHRLENLSFEESLSEVKKSFEAAILAGFDLIHVDPTVDIRLKSNEAVDINWVIKYTAELIIHCENFIQTNNLPRIAYEVGTEEVHGGLSNQTVFKEFLEGLKNSLSAKGFNNVWPCFVVGKVGTDLHTTEFDPIVAGELTEIASQYGSLIKGHYSDNVTNPEQYPLSGMGAANVGPEFTENEYDGLMELVTLENNLINSKLLGQSSEMKEVLWTAVIESGRWSKWLSDSENKQNFYANSIQRQDWLIKTGCRYVWENEEVVAAREKLYYHLELFGFKAEEIVLSKIEKSMDKYFRAFNLIDLNAVILEEIKVFV